VPTTETRLLNITEVADRLGVDVRHVRRLVYERRIPFIKLGPPAALRPRRDRGMDRSEPPAAPPGGRSVRFLGPSRPGPRRS